MIAGSESEFRPIGGGDRGCEGGLLDPSRHPQEGEPDFIETNCHWKGCKKEFETQDELVRVSLIDFPAGVETHASPVVLG